MRQTKKYFSMDINNIKPYENNPRYNEQAVEVVKESIKQCTYIAPIVIDEDNIILAGHTRHKALIDLGYTGVEVIQVTGLTKTQKKKYRLLDNKTNELAEWNFDLLEQELEGLDFQGFNFGFDNEEYESFDIAEDNSTKKVRELKIKVADFEIPITEQEQEDFLELFKKYCKEYGVKYGFIGYICRELS